MHTTFWLLVAVFVFASLPVASAVDETFIDLQSIIDEASAGDVIDLAAGTYAGGVVISKPLTITGHDWPTIDSGGAGTVIEVMAPDVTIQNLVIRNSGASLDREDGGVSVLESRVTIRNNRFEDVLFGIFLRTSRDSLIIDNTIGAKDVFIANRGDGIRLWESAGSTVEGNVIEGGRDTVFWFTDNIVVRNNQISGGRYGLHFMYSDGAVIEGNVLSSNSVGAFMMYSYDVTIRNNVMADNSGPSGYGLGLKDMDDFDISGNRFVSNRVGMYLDNSPSAAGSEGWIEDNLFAYNQIGASFLPAVKNNNFSGNTFIDNVEQVGITSSGHFVGNAWSVNGRGNYWSDFAGYDADGDGVGDVAYKVDDLYNTLTDEYPDLAFFNETPASKAIGLAARMFPVLRPDPIIEDEHPLVNRPQLAPIQTLGGHTGIGLLATSLLMLAGAVALVYIPSRRRNSSRARTLA
jgi:nitrous oxidase accessory protein